jgi:hypothetical protein
MLPNYGCRGCIDATMDRSTSPFHKENRRLLAEVTSEERLYQSLRALLSRLVSLPTDDVGTPYTMTRLITLS